MKRGQIQIGIAIIGAISMLGASIVAAWGTSSVKVNVVEERQKNQYEALKNTIEANDKKYTERWDRIEDVLNKIAPPTVQKTVTQESKAELFPTKAEQKEKAPIITGQLKNGAPKNE